LELAHTKGSCNNNCAACPLNVHLYVDDPREATLIKTSAAIDYHRQSKYEAKYRAWKTGQDIGHLILFIFGMALFVVLFVWPVTCVVKGVKSLIPKEGSYEYPSTMATTASPEVQRKATMVSRAILNLGDITNDGLYDCIDDALGFYELYGGECQILWLVVGTWSHLFVAIPNGYGQWAYIETRTKSSKFDDILLQRRWSSDILSHIREARNVTPYYKSIKAGTHVWRW